MPPAPAGGGRNVEIVHRRAQTSCGVECGVDRPPVVPLLEGCARFLHAGLTVVNRPASAAEGSGRHARHFGRPELRARRVKRGLGVGDRLRRAGARGGFAADRFLGGGLGALAGVERGVERLAIVALGDSVTGPLEGVLGRGELLAGVLIGPGRARRVDSALRLLYFLVGAIAGRHPRHRRKHGERQEEATERRHAFEYSAASQHDELTSVR